MEIRHRLAARTTRIIESELPNNHYYHGTSYPLSPGDIVTPPSETGNISEKGRKKNLDRVFMTKDKGSANIYAGRAANALGGMPRTVVVEPIGHVEALNLTPGTSVYHTSRARVVSVT